MGSPQMKMPEKKTETVETDPVEYFSQRKKPEVGRFLLQVDRQTKGAYQTAEAAESAGLAIKKDYPVVHVTVYDTVEYATSIISKK
jgi:formylglycine-generating enzyme required for sulfatase activity